MKRSAIPIFSFALLLALTAGPAFASDKAAAMVKADAEKADPTVKADAEKADAAVRTDADKTDAVVRPAISPLPDKPDKLNGDELAMSCKAEVQGFDAGYCLGVVEGVMASMRVCKRDHSVITLGEAADAVEKYLSNHPDKLNEREVVLARKALSKAYPCGRQ